jgi:hypothetical protein
MFEEFLNFTIGDLAGNIISYTAAAIIFIFIFDQIALIKNVKKIK